MKHIDEHILELYVLRDVKILRKKVSIEKHLRECAGCRELAKKIQTFHTDVKEELQTPYVSKMDSNALIKTKETMPELWHKPNLPVSTNWSLLQKWTPIELQRFWFNVGNFVYQKPIIATVGSLIFLGVLLFFINLGVEKTWKDVNPSYYHYNAGAKKAEFYNKENALLWSLPDQQSSDEVTTIERTRKAYRYLIIDLNNDGKNEVITTNEFLPPQRSLLLYSFDGRLQKTISPGDETIHFRDLKYDTKLYSVTLSSLIDQIKDTKEIIISASLGRSPACIVRLDDKLNIIGKYWHFGNIYGRNILIDRKQFILTWGINDVDDMSGNSFPMLVILDPERIIGNKESSVSSGFGYTQSDAERYYIKFPKTDIEKITVKHSAVVAITYETDSTFAANVEFTAKERVSFEYIFNKKDMTVREVKFSTEAQLLHTELKKEGKLISSFDKSYLENLKNGVRYWDGVEWKKKPIRIQHNADITSK